MLRKIFALRADAVHVHRQPDLRASARGVEETFFLLKEENHEGNPIIH